MQNNIESHLVEKRVFKPPRDFAKRARIKSLGQYRRMYRESIRQPAKLWAREAGELVWHARWKKVLEWKPPFAKWFVGGKRSEEHTSELQSRLHLVCRPL